jgi:hypothetical protein
MTRSSSPHPRLAEDTELDAWINEGHTFAAACHPSRPTARVPEEGTIPQSTAEFTGIR